MRWLVFIVCLLASQAALAQSPALPGFPPGVILNRGAIDAASSSPSYQGPDDVTTAQAALFWSCARAISASYASGGGSLCDIVDTATGGFTCTIAAGANGFAVLNGTNCTGGVGVTTFCTVTHSGGCSITKIYDQSNTLCGANPCFATQATLADMPLLQLSAANGLPCPSISTTSQNMLTTWSTSGASNQPVTFSTVLDRTGNIGSRLLSLQLQSSNIAQGTSTTANQGEMNGGSTINFTMNDSTFHSLISVFNGASSSYDLDGAGPITVSAGTNNITSFASFAIAIAFSGGFGLVCEDIVYASGISSADQAALTSNQQGSAYGYNF